MEPGVVEAGGQLHGAIGAGDLSLFGLFLAADPVVKVVMILLLVLSVWCWAIIIEKALRLGRLRRRARRFEDSFWSGGSLDDLYDRVGETPRDPMEAVFAAGMDEWRQSGEVGLGSSDTLKIGVQQRIDRIMHVAQTREAVKSERGMTVLATVGSSAPFVGLFGTVWGIMNSFTAIAESANTSLAVVAPGIAEALFATALGLFAAIPASAAYNKFSSDLGAYAEQVENFAGEFSAILSRHLQGRN